MQITMYTIIVFLSFSLVLASEFKIMIKNTLIYFQLWWNIDTKHLYYFILIFHNYLYFYKFTFIYYEGKNYTIENSHIVAKTVPYHFFIFEEISQLVCISLIYTKNVTFLPLSLLFGAPFININKQEYSFCRTALK